MNRIKKKQAEKQVIKFVKGLWKNEAIPSSAQAQKRLEEGCMDRLKEFKQLVKEHMEMEEYIKKASYILADFGTLKSATKAMILKSSILKEGNYQNLWIMNVTSIGIPLEGIISDILTATEGKLVKNAFLFIDSKGNYDEFIWGTKVTKGERCVVVSPIIVDEIERAINYLSSTWNIEEIIGIINLSHKEKLSCNGREVKILSLF